MVQFSISETGKIRDVKVLRGVYPSLDKETVRVIESSPDWVPAKVNGKNVQQQLVMPVVFMIQ
jgi:protein TonB